MDRLTFDGNFCDIAMCLETPGGSFCEDGYCSQRKVWERLKQYEDTGLEPEKILTAIDMAKIVCSLRALEAYRNLGSIDHIGDLLQAEQDGRLVVLPKEDAEFLAALRHELLTQPTDGNRDPRFWGVIEEELEFGYQEKFGKGWGVWDNDNCRFVGYINDLQSVIDELIDEDGYDYGEEEFTDCEDIESVIERANELGGSFSISYYRRRHVVSDEHIFLTKKACQEYIDRYGYNHNKPHTYVMTAERCPEYARLLKILKETKWIGGAE